MNRRNTTLFSALTLGCVAFLLRLGYVAWFPQQPVTGDAGLYVELGQNLIHGRGFLGAIAGPPDSPTSMRTPLYPLLLAGVFWTGGSVTDVRVVQAFLGALTAFGTYYVALRVAGPAVASIAATLTAVSVPLIAYTGTLQTETIFSLLIVLIASAHQRFQAELSVRAAALLGFLCGLSSLCRAEMAIYPVVALGLAAMSRRETAVATSNPQVGRTTIGTTVVLAIALVGSMSVTILPWTVRNAITFKRFIPLTTQAGHVVWLATDPRELTDWNRADEPLRSALRNSLDEVELSARLWQAGLDNLGQHPLTYVGLSLRRLGRFIVAGHSQVIAGLEVGMRDAWQQRLWGIVVTKSLFVVANIGFMVLALVGVARVRATPMMLPLAGLVAFKALFHAATYADGRYHVPLLPIVYVLAAVSISVFVPGRAESVDKNMIIEEIA